MTGDNLASLVSGVLCDAGTIPVAETNDVKGLHDGLRALLAERDTAVRELDDMLRAEWVWKDRAEAAEAERDAAVQAAEQADVKIQALRGKWHEQTERAKAAEQAADRAAAVIRTEHAAKAIVGGGPCVCQWCRKEQP